MSAIKSQLAALSGAVATVQPQSQLARMIVADLKGGEAKHNFHMSIIASAIVQALKGNQRDIPEAVKLCVGKSAKARSYHAGFAAIIHELAPVKYVGKLDLPTNAAAREEIALRSQALEFAFEGAFLAMLQQCKDESAASRAATKAEKDASAGAPVASDTSADAPVATVVAEHAVVEIDTAVDAVCRALDAKLLNADEVARIRYTLALYDNNIEEAVRLEQEADAELALAA